MITRRLVGLAVSLTLVGCAQPPCELCGRWRSDAPRTLAEMAAAEHLSDDQRRFFSDDFFGRLIVEIRADTFRAYFIDEDASQAPWGSWETVSTSESAQTIRYQVEDGWEQRTYEIHGNCYRTHVEGLGFAEWFCRESGD